MISGYEAADWKQRADLVKFRTEPFILGRARASRASETFASINPATGSEICRLSVGSADDVDDAVAAARMSFDDGRWRLLSPLQRSAILLRIAELIEANGDELALLDCLEMGKAISDARAEIAYSVGFFRYYGQAIDKLYGQIAPSVTTSLALQLLEPRGVVGAIVPWNFPLINASLKIAPALAAGNSVVLKPSELTSTSVLRLAELATEAGVPDGVLNIVPGLGATVGAALGLHPDVDLLSFTGSTTTGRRLMHYSADSNGKPLMLECGGKSPQIVCGDMGDVVEQLAGQVAHEAFWNIGQWCIARSRLIVHRSVYDGLMDALLKVVAELVPGDPLDPATRLGAIASQTQHDRVMSFATDAGDNGAALRCGHDQPEGCFIAPMIYENVPAGCKMVREEVFGPVLVASVFDDFDEAVMTANDTEYGLAASVWTRDLNIAHRAGREIKAGKIDIRSNPTFSEGAGFASYSEPWGASGFGVEGGLEGLRSYHRYKAVQIGV